MTFFTDNIIIDGMEQVLPVGTKKYKFEFEIPKDGHNSFSAPGASFSYMLKCTVDIPWGIDAEGTLELFVNEVKDLNDSIGPFSLTYWKDLEQFFRDAGDGWWARPDQCWMWLLRPGAN